jgi:hypothetical protein
VRIAQRSTSRRGALTKNRDDPVTKHRHDRSEQAKCHLKTLGDVSEQQDDGSKRRDDRSFRAQCVSV